MSCHVSEFTATLSPRRPCTLKGRTKNICAAQQCDCWENHVVDDANLELIVAVCYHVFSFVQ